MKDVDGGFWFIARLHFAIWGLWALIGVVCGAVALYTFPHPLSLLFASLHGSFIGFAHMSWKTDAFTRGARK